MPTYEYVCTNCQNQWEEIQKISEPALEECPKCHQHTAKRQISGGSFILKGGGWYADAYSSAGNKKSESSASPDASGSAKAESKTETKAETKSETKTETKAPETKAPAAPTTKSE